MYEEILQDPRVVAALAKLPAADRDRARDALAASLTVIGQATVDQEIGHEMLDGPRRAPHWRASRADLLRKNARRRAEIGDPAAPVFDAAAQAAEDVDTQGAP
jgi:hypothetical protein